MQYTVHPVECQPQWPEQPEPIRYPWAESLLGVACAAIAIYLVATGLNSAYLLAVGS